MQRLSNLSSIVSDVQKKPNQIIQLPFAIYDMKDAIKTTAGLRPYREGGIRMEKEVLLMENYENGKQNTKMIFHNYGHGGGGISVGYGCVEHVIQKLFKTQNVKKTEQIAVFGFGIIGITTAYFLTKMGYKVNVYAQIYPFEAQTSTQPQITTTVAAGYWMPLKMGNKQQSKNVAVSTWNHYQDLLTLQKKTNKSYGIVLMPTYCINDNQGLTYFRIQGIIQPKNTKVTFGDGLIHQTIVFNSFAIDSDIYLRYLWDQIKKTGLAKFNKTKILSQHIPKLNQKYIFNCCGLTAPNLFKDQNTNKGIKGHVMAFDLSKYPQTKGFMLFMKTKQGRWILQVPHHQSNRLCLGISYEEGKKDAFPQKQQLQRVFNTSNNFFKKVAENQLKTKKIYQNLKK